MNFEKSVVIVSGASRGIGAEICVQMSAKLSIGSVVVGIGRSADAIGQTGEKVERGGAKFIPWVTDLSRFGGNVEDFRAVLRKAFDMACSTDGDVKNITMIHNAGSLGDLNYLRDAKFQDMSVVQDYFNMNLCSLYPMNQVFLAEARQLVAKCPDAKIRVVNITSLAAIKPFSTWGLYCTGKAARDMLFKVLSTEEEDVTVLSYSPGPVDTDMQAKVRTTPDEKIRVAFTAMKESNNILTTEQTVTKMIAVLQKGDFASGDHVDYFD